MKHKRERRWCYYCRFSGPRFSIGGGRRVLLCEHPDDEVRGNSGWDSVRECFSTCDAWEPIPNSCEQEAE